MRLGFLQRVTIDSAAHQAPRSDALVAEWVIGLATPVELPLFTDMCKFEMASLFEYATIPITPKPLVEFCSANGKY